MCASPETLTDRILFGPRRPRPPGYDGRGHAPFSSVPLFPRPVIGVSDGGKSAMGDRFHTPPMPIVVSAVHPARPSSLIPTGPENR